MQNPSSKFLYKYLIVVTLCLLALQLKKQLFPKPISEEFHISLLKTNKILTDSLISSMSDSAKIQLILAKELFFIDSTDYNMINDSIFFEKYINNLLTRIKNEGKLFYAYYPAKSQFDDLKDTSFLNFQIKRYRYINTLAKKKALFAGWVYPHNVQIQIKSIINNKNTQFAEQQVFFKKQNIFHIFENEYTGYSTWGFEGLKISFIDTLNKDLNKEILNFLNSDYQLLFIKPTDKKVAHEIIASLINKYPRYRNLFYKKLRKLVKFIYYLRSKNIKKQTSLKNKNILPYLLKEKSIFIIQKNTAQTLPLQTGIVYSIIKLTDTIPKEFLKIFSNYAMYISETQKNFKKKILSGQIKKYRHIILINDSTFKKFSTDSLNKLLLQFPKEKSIIINFAKFDYLANITDSINIIQMPDDLKISHHLAPQVIFGGLSVSGQIPRSLNQQILFGKSEKQKASRLGYSPPERVNVSSNKLGKINHIVHEAIEAKAFPGCQVFIAKSGKVIYNKSFGYHSYQKIQKVKNSDLYDLASLTKIAATTIAAMKMINDRKLSINDELGKFFKDTKIDYTRIKPDTLIKIDTFYIKQIANFVKNKDTIHIDSSKFITIDTLIAKLTPKNNIFKIQLIDLLKHKSGINPSLPIYKYVYYRYIYFSTLINAHKAFQKQLSHLLQVPYIEIPDTVLKQVHLPDSIDSIIKYGLKEVYFKYFSKNKTDSSNIQICNNLYLRNMYLDTIWNDTKQLTVAKQKYTKYSDINMILLQMAIDSLNKMNIDHFMKKTIYHPIGLKNISYKPLNKIDIKRICPTENDRSWRYCLLQAYVHDPSAAILGGIAGNAGLFSNASDLGILFQMLLNGGTYGGKQYIHSDIIKQFTTRQEDTQRGLGFDMPNSHAIVGSLAPANTFGHSGFTGTCIWVDPENELIYVFLSNRIHPSAKNWKIISLKIRERIHNAVYEAIIEDN